MTSVSDLSDSGARFSTINLISALVVLIECRSFGLNDCFQPAKIGPPKIKLPTIRIEHVLHDSEAQAGPALPHIETCAAFEYA